MENSRNQGPKSEPSRRTRVLDELTWTFPPACIPIMHVVRWPGLERSRLERILCGRLPKTTSVPCLRLIPGNDSDPLTPNNDGSWDRVLIEMNIEIHNIPQLRAGPGQSDATITSDIAALSCSPEEGFFSWFQEQTNKASRRVRYEGRQKKKCTCIKLIDRKADVPMFRDAASAVRLWAHPRCAGCIPSCS